MRLFRYYFLIIVLSSFPLVSIFSSNLLPHTHDGLVHLARIGAYFKALHDGQIPVRWAGDLNYGYGMPLFNFMYQVPYAIASVLIFLGLGLVSSFKITLALSFILSGIFMLGFSLAFFQDYKKAILVTIFYQFVPFRIIEILIRGSFGEVYAYAFLPLVLWGIVVVFKKQNYWSILLTSISTALLIISHNALSLVFFIITLGFVITFGENKKNYILGIASLFLGLLLASFYWIPALFEHKYTYGDLFMKNLYLSHFPPLLSFFTPNFLNNKSLQTGGIAVQIGLFHMLVLFVAIFTFFHNKKITYKLKKLFIFCFIIFAIALFFMQPISKPIWSHVAQLRQFQFSWRFLSVVGFATSLLSVCLLNYNFFNKKWIYFTILFMVIFSTAYYWKPSLGLDKINENYYWNFPLNTTYFGETDVIWSQGPKNRYPKKRIEIIGGKGEITDFQKKSNLQTFSVDAKTDIQLVDHTQYFPGWRAYSDNMPVPIQFQDQHWRGEIIFFVPKGKHEIKVVFGESKTRFIADMLTMGTIIFLAFFGLFRKTIRFI